MSSCFSSSSVGYPNWVRGGLVAKLGTRRGHKHLLSGVEKEKGSVGPGWRREAKEIEGRRRETERENEGKYETERELLSLSVWNERMHERLLQTVERAE